MTDNDENNYEIEKVEKSKPQDVNNFKEFFAQTPEPETIAKVLKESNKKSKKQKKIDKKLKTESEKLAEEKIARKNKEDYEKLVLERRKVFNKVFDEIINKFKTGNYVSQEILSEILITIQKPVMFENFNKFLDSLNLTDAIVNLNFLVDYFMKIEFEKLVGSVICNKLMLVQKPEIAENYYFLNRMEQVEYLKKQWEYIKRCNSFGYFKR